MSTSVQRRRQKRHRDKKKQLAQSKEKQRRSAKRPPRSIRYELGPEFLQTNGPVLPGLWSQPEALKDFLLAAGSPIAQPEVGALLVDTGATTTCISLDAAHRLGLKPTRIARGYGAGGEHRNPVFLARLNISIQNPKTKAVTTIEWEMEVQGIPELERHSELAYGGRPMRVVGLLGRDILQHCRLSYDGIKGIIQITFDLESLSSLASKGPTI